MSTETYPPPGDAMFAGGYRGIVLSRLAEQAVAILDVRESCIFVQDQADPDMAIVAAARGPDEEMVGKRVPVELENSRALHGALIQLRWDGDVQGALSVGTVGSPPLSSSDTALLEAFAPTVGAAIGHAHLPTGSRPSLRNQIGTLTAALRERGLHTARHSHDVVAMSRSIGIAMGMDGAALAELEVAALLHDVGKLLVPDSIVKKPGLLTSEQHALMARHPTHGAQVLASVPGLEVVANIVRYHQARWDGGGHPDGLTGARIPLASRIIAVCDSYTAMISERPNGRAMSHLEAAGELRANAGWQFDPDVTSAVDHTFERKAGA